LKQQNLQGNAVCRFCLLFLIWRKQNAMTSAQVLSELKTMGSESIRRILSKHGAPPQQYGVKVEDLKKIQKKVKKDYALSLELFDSGIPEAQYLAGLIADESKMTSRDLQHWAENASWHMISEYSVAWISAESNHGRELALKWIDSKSEKLQSSGWTTLASLVGIVPDEKLDLKELKFLLERVQKEIHSAGNRVPYAMNAFVIAIGGHVKELSALAIKTGKDIGVVTVDMEGTACKVPYAPDYIKKIVDRGIKKKKMARC
jgi:3-methyladenine DNA glycosylase AlkD